MLHDFDSPESPAPGHADVCIVGAGAAGILLATQLAAAGRSVTLLEGGGREQESRSQEIYRSELPGLPYKGIHTGRFRTWGGTTTQWGGQILELDDVDFGARAHVEGSGWPFAKSILTGFYERALRFEGLRRVETDDARVRALLGLGEVDLGPDFAMLYSRWCPERNFAELHAEELAHSRRLSRWVHASVTGLNLNDDRTAIRSVAIRGFGGRKATVTAETFVLCLGGIETTRVLLQPMREGLTPWQSNGILGRFYQDHIGVNGIRIGAIAAQPAWRHFGYVTAGGFRYHNKLRLSSEQQVAHGTLNVAGTIGPFSTEHPRLDRANVTLRSAIRQRRLPAVGDALNAAAFVPAIAAGLASQRLRGEGPAWKRTMLTVHAEQSPLSGSKITLAPERDELGLLRTRLDWQVSAEELHTIRTYVRLAAATFAERGFAQVTPPAGFFEDDALLQSMCGDSNHHMGSTRMSVAAADGVVDPDLRLHGIDNGYVCSSSVFPSSGFSNPTHTLLALAMRLADRLSGVPAAPGASRAATASLPTGNPTSASSCLVALPGGGRRVPQLGFGCAYLLGPGLDAARSRRLLDAAYAAGVRHFDVARLYGKGSTEALLGEFLREHRDATVTTKYGIVPPNGLQRVAAAVQREVPALAGVYRRKDKARFTAADAQASLEVSLRKLGRDHVEVFLLHEATPADLVHEDLLVWLEAQRAAGKIGAFGIGGEFYRMEELLRERPGYGPVMQFECSVFGPHLDLPGVARVHYRTFARPAAALGRRFARDRDLARRWSSVVDAELDEPLLLSRLLLKASLDEGPESLVLFSTRSEEHIFDNMAVAADETLREPARRLRQLAREEELGVTEELYGDGGGR